LHFYSYYTGASLRNILTVLFDELPVPDRLTIPLEQVTENVIKVGEFGGLATTPYTATTAVVPL
jgi:hypothetical protein